MDSDLEHFLPLTSSSRWSEAGRANDGMHSWPLIIAVMTTDQGSQATHQDSHDYCLRMSYLLITAGIDLVRTVMITDHDCRGY